MGMEGYFFALEFKSLKQEDIKEHLKEHCLIQPYKMPSGKLFKKYIVDRQRFTIDGKAVVRIYEEGGVSKTTFELCFTNFENNLLYIFNVAKDLSLKSNSVSVVIYNQKYDFDEMLFEEFKSILIKAYKNKIKLFESEYGVINVDILPANFYKKYRK